MNKAAVRPEPVPPESIFAGLWRFTTVSTRLSAGPAFRSFSAGCPVSRAMNLYPGRPRVSNQCRRQKSAECLVPPEGLRFQVRHEEHFVPCRRRSNGVVPSLAWSDCGEPCWCLLLPGACSSPVVPAWGPASAGVRPAAAVCRGEPQWPSEPLFSERRLRTVGSKGFFVQRARYRDPAFAMPFPGSLGSLRKTVETPISASSITVRVTSHHGTFVAGFNACFSSACSPGGDVRFASQ